MKRGEIVTVALPGAYGKPRPAVIIQANWSLEAHPSVMLCPLSSHLVDAPLYRIGVQPDERNGLRQPSQIAVDKISTVPRDKVGDRIGVLDDDTMTILNRALVTMLGVVP